MAEAAWRISQVAPVQSVGTSSGAEADTRWPTHKAVIETYTRIARHTEETGSAFNAAVDEYRQRHPEAARDRAARTVARILARHDAESLIGAG